MASLTLRAITKKFGRVPALAGVDLNVADGEFCVLLGPSGCGKSTLLNIIAGLIPQDHVTVMLDGEPVDQLPPRTRDVAMVFQSYALYPHMTVAQNLGFGLRMRRTPRQTIQKQVQEAAGLLGIEGLLDRKPRELSGGQRQRVAMGRALVRRPRIFLLDEPLSNLDARLRASVRLELKELHRQIGSTIIFVTHDQVEAMTLGDSVVVMREGTIHQNGPPEKIYSHPADTFVATFIGSPEMNLYQGRLVQEEGNPHFEGSGFSLPLTGLKSGLPTGEADLGIRPEDIGVDGSDAAGLEGCVEMISDVGSEKYIHARMGQERITVRVPKDFVCRVGDIVPLVIDPHKVHLFCKGLSLDVY
jgi:multiple sugar transport system ATP-binding protein